LFVFVLLSVGRRVVAERVLVVDDDAGLLAMMCEDLQKQGLACVCARSDREAYKLLATQPFDAIVVDVNLGIGTTGFDVARRARQVTPEIRVVYISGDANARSWMTFGVPSSDYVSKPFPLDRLAGLLRHGLDRPPARPSVASQPPSSD
jgi:DNA-binding response OmpR family regulator